MDQMTPLLIIIILGETSSGENVVVSSFYSVPHSINKINDLREFDDQYKPPKLSAFLQNLRCKSEKISQVHLITTTASHLDYK